MKTMICIGDSLTEGADIVKEYRWPQRVGNALAMNVTNQGIGGDTTQGMLSRFSSGVLVKKPEFVLILGGTNDLWWGLEVNTTLGNLFSMVFQARHYGIVPILGLPMPVNIDTARKNDFSPPWGGYEQLVKEMTKLVDKLSFYANESEVVTIDLHKPFFDARQKIRQDLFQPDGLHPNRSGHRVISNSMVTTFQGQLSFYNMQPHR